LDSDRTVRRLVVGIKAEVIPDVDVSTDHLVFDVDRASTQLVELKSNNLKAFSVSHVVCTHGAFKAAIQKSGNGDRQTATVLVTFDPDKWHDSRHKAELHITTNSRAEPLMRIGLSVTAPVQRASP